MVHAIPAAKTAGAAVTLAPEERWEDIIPILGDMP